MYHHKSEGEQQQQKEEEDKLGFLLEILYTSRNSSFQGMGRGGSGLHSFLNWFLDDFFSLILLFVSKLCDLFG